LTAIQKDSVRLTERTSQSGYTLLELLVVLAILGLIIAIAAPRVMGIFEGSKAKAAKIEIANLAAAMGRALFDPQKRRQRSLGPTLSLQIPRRARGLRHLDPRCGWQSRRNRQRPRHRLMGVTISRSMTNCLSASLGSGSGA
jgi:prepilin-type N-terminal cleavage/methylation domain-containing protein